MDKETQKNLLEVVKKNYEEIAAEFDATRKKALWPELLKLAETVKDGNRVLDVGCGNGRLAVAFEGKKIFYLGVDSSERLIESAKKNLDSRLRGNDKGERGNDKRGAAPRNDNGSYEFKNADILELDKLPENNFDYVFCIAVLHHLPGLDLRVKALKQLKDKLKPGGKIILTVWNLWSRPKFLKLIVKTFLNKILLNLGLMSRRYGRDPDFALRTSGDFGDIMFDWKNAQGQRLSRRYYHAFMASELKKITAEAGLKMEKIYHDGHNYYCVLSS